jgi:HEAT repeat protein
MKSSIIPSDQALKRFGVLLAATISLQLFASAALKEQIRDSATAAMKVQAGESVKPFRDLEVLIRALPDQPQLRQDIEAALIRLLAPEATYEAKAFACKQLALVGTSRAVPALAKLLQDESTAGVACIALERIPGRQAGEALKDALPRSTPGVQVQILNTLGDRKESTSLPTLARALGGPDQRVVESAIAAIGKIGTREAFEILSRTAATSPSTRTIMNEALLSCARNLAQGKERKIAIVIYNQLLTEGQPLYVRRAALGELIKLDPDGGVTRTLEVLKSGDSALKPVAIQAVAHLPGRAVSELFVPELEALSPVEQAWLLESLSHRGDLVARVAIANSLRSPFPEVRTAGIQILTSIGGAAAVPLFARAIEDAGTQEEIRDLEVALVNLSGGRLTDDAIRAGIAESKPVAKAHLLTALSRRQGPEANRILVDYALNPDADVKQAALRALKRTATSAEASPLLKVLARAKDPVILNEARIASERALSQQPNISIRSSLVRDALGNTSDPEVRATLVALLPLAADSSAWRTVRETCTDPNPMVREAALEAVSEWPNMDAWDALLQTYRKPANPAERAAALRALVRLAGEFNSRPDLQMMKKYEQLFASATADAEYKQILGVLSGAAHPEALALAVNQLSREGVRAEAIAAINKLAESVKLTHPEQAAAALKKASESL